MEEKGRKGRDFNGGERKGEEGRGEKKRYFN